ncbi:MAG: hypothetical protein J6Z11_00475 [Candidatus Riflebacteria bacterium]|nr:hypothetical protein [Candidatus Riflebacteria bacterium]
MADYNQQYFSKKDIEKGLHTEFINFLLEKLRTDEYHVDIHIVQESNGAITVEWVRQRYNLEDDMGSFKFVDGDQVIVSEDSIQYVEEAYNKLDKKQKKKVQELLKNEE